MRIYFNLRDWEWWKLFTKIKPLVNVQKTEEDLREREVSRPLSTSGHRELVISCLMSVCDKVER